MKSFFFPLWARFPRFPLDNEFPDTFYRLNLIEKLEENKTQKPLNEFSKHNKNAKLVCLLFKKVNFGKKTAHAHRQYNP